MYIFLVDGGIPTITILRNLFLKKNLQVLLFHFIDLFILFGGGWDFEEI